MFWRAQIQAHHILQFLDELATFVEAPKQRNTREEKALIKENAIPIEWGKDDKTRRYKLA